MHSLIRASLALTVLLAAVVFAPQIKAGQPGLSGQQFQVLAPIRQDNLTVFPVTAASTHDTSEFLTLDEGLRSGTVVVTEAGQLPGMVRRRGTYVPQPRGGPQVNHLFIINNSKRPLVLLAGEIVTGGKQDRIVGKDRILPAGADADLDVFCVEPGRWVEARGVYNFGAASTMAAPSVRNQAMARKSQQGVWDRGNQSNETMTVAVEDTGELSSTSSYARVMENDKVRKKVDKIAGPLERSYQSVIGELRDRKAVGVVVAVNGELIWADIFASTEMLEKYWPKLVRSYAAEALTRRGPSNQVDVKQAHVFLAALEGNHEQTDTEPGVYRQSEISGRGYRVFELISLLPGTGFEVHVSKMAE